MKPYELTRSCMSFFEGSSQAVYYTKGSLPPAETMRALITVTSSTPVMGLW